MTDNVDRCEEHGNVDRKIRKRRKLKFQGISSTIIPTHTRINKLIKAKTNTTTCLIIKLVWNLAFACDQGHCINRMLTLNSSLSIVIDLCIVITTQYNESKQSQ